MTDEGAFCPLIFVYYGVYYRGVFLCFLVFWKVLQSLDS